MNLKLNPNIKCDKHKIMNCPSCFQLQSDIIMKEIEEKTKFKKIKSNKSKTTKTNE